MKMVKLINKAKRAIMYGQTIAEILKSHEVKEVTEDVAAILLKLKGVEIYVPPKDMENVTEENAKLKKELEALKKENAKLKKELEALKATKTTEEA